MQSRQRFSLMTTCIALCALTAIAQAQTPAPTAAPSATDLFTKADKNHDGKLSRDESKALPAIADKFDTLDKDKDGSLNIDEFSAGVQANPMK
jgi:hypothetical protein